MAQRLNWQKRAFDLKPKRALKDEEEFFKTDRAARFLQRAEQSLSAHRHERRKTAAAKKHQSEARPCSKGSGNRAAHEKGPWEH